MKNFKSKEIKALQVIVGGSDSTPITGQLKKEDKVSLVGFGSFSCSMR